MAAHRAGGCGSADHRHSGDISSTTTGDFGQCARCHRPCNNGEEVSTAALSWSAARRQYSVGRSQRRPRSGARGKVAPVLSRAGSVAVGTEKQRVNSLRCLLKGLEFALLPGRARQSDAAQRRWRAARLPTSRTARGPFFHCDSAPTARLWLSRYDRRKTDPAQCSYTIQDLPVKWPVSARPHRTKLIAPGGKPY